MKNNSERKMYIIMFGLALFTMVFLIIFWGNAIKQSKMNCDCSGNVISVIDQKIDTYKDEILKETEKIAADVAEIKETLKNNPKKQEALISSTEQTATVTIPSKFKIGEAVPLPSLPTHVKFCTDYRCYNLWYTPHYRLQQAAYTDEKGLRRFNDDYIVGLGKFYSESIGDRFKITLDTGNEFTVFFGDGKAPCDCDGNNMYTPCKNYNGEECANVLEFIIDKEAISKEVYAYGSIDCLAEFAGNIVKMEYLGRDDSADWDTYETR